MFPREGDVELVSNCKGESGNDTPAPVHKPTRQKVSCGISLPSRS